MDTETATRFVSSLAQSIQALCHGYVDFHSSIEVIGHIYLNVDNGSKFNYVVNEEISKFPHNHASSTMFRTHSYYSVPPTKLHNVSHPCYKDLDPEILVVSNNGFSKKSKDLTVSLQEKKQFNLSSCTKELNIPCFNNEKGNDCGAKIETQAPNLHYDLFRIHKEVQQPVNLNHDLSKSHKEVQQQSNLNYDFSKSHKEVQQTSNPSRRKRKKSEIFKCVNHSDLEDEDVDVTVLKNNIDDDLNNIQRNKEHLQNDKLLTCPFSENKFPSTQVAANVIKKKRRKSEPHKYIPHSIIKHSESSDSFHALKNEPEETLLLSNLETEASEADLEIQNCSETLVNCDYKDSLPFSSLGEPDFEQMNSSPLYFSRDSSLTDTLNTSFSSSAKTITTQLRQQIVEYANIVGNRPAARHFGVHESSIRHWRKRFIYGDAAVKKKKKKKDLHLIEKEIENVELVESVSVSS